jgi:HK97 family phage prohead protease
MTKETKFISLAQFKAIEDGPGGFEGYVTTFGELDDGGDIILRGAYQETIPQFLTRGFTAEAHDWSFSGMIGYPTAAQEDDTGLYSAMEFHSTPDAQMVRVKAAERMAAGKGVYSSIGYEPAGSPIFIQPSDYATEIPKYSAPNLVEQNLAKASTFSRVRVLPKLHLYEYSLVTVPMLQSAAVTAIKSGADVQEDDDLVDGRSYSADLKALVDDACRVIDRTEKRAALRLKEGRVLSSANWQALADMCDQMDELSKRVRSMLDEAKPKPKEDGGKEEEASKTFDIQAVLNHLMVVDLQLKGVPIK